MTRPRPIQTPLPPGWKKRHRNQAGHTLMEVMVAAAVFAVGALGLLRLMYGSVEGTAAAKRITQASAIGRTKLDELQRVEYDDLLPGTVQEGTVNGDKNVGPAGTPYKPDGSSTGAWGSTDGWFYRTWTITTDASTPPIPYKSIEVQVQWYDHSIKRVRSITVSGGKSQ